MTEESTLNFTPSMKKLLKAKFPNAKARGPALVALGICANEVIFFSNNSLWNYLYTQRPLNAYNRTKTQ